MNAAVIMPVHYHLGNLARAVPWAVAFIGLFLAIPAQAQDANRAVAFVQAPEQSDGMCFGNSPEEAFGCAVKQCTANGTLAEDCLPMKYCSPAGWSADIFKQHKEGLHWHDYLCGWDSEADLDAAVKVACEGSAKVYLMECSVVAKWSPEGTRIGEP